MSREWVTGKERRQLRKKDAALIIEQVQKQGLHAVAVANRITVYRKTVKGDDSWIGGFYWSKAHRAWRPILHRPYMHTRNDLDLVLGEMRKEQERIVDIEEEWENFRERRKGKQWRTYLGAVISFYNRMFG